MKTLGKFALFAKRRNETYHLLLTTFDRTELEKALDMPRMMGDVGFVVAKAVSNYEGVDENKEAHEYDWVAIDNPYLRLKHASNGILFEKV